MSYTAPDFSDDVIKSLTADGYVVLGRDSDGNDLEPEHCTDEAEGVFWFTWAAPGMAECEVGDDCDNPLLAWLSALRHRLANSTIPMEEVAKV